MIQQLRIYEIFEHNKADWRQFMADEEWKEVKRVTNSEHGDLVGEIEDRILVPTTYSPIAPAPSPRLGRIAAVGRSGRPHVVPVGFRKQPRVAFVVDDLASVSPWRPDGIEVRGQAEVLASGGEAFRRGYAPEIFRIRPRRIVSLGLDGGSRRVTVRP